MAKSCTWGKNIRCRLCEDQLESSFTGKNLVILVDMHQKWELGTKKANKILGIRQSVPSNLREGSSCVSLSIGETTPGALCPVLRSLVQERQGLTGAVLEHLS